MTQPTILLDLNYTLISNSIEKRNPFIKQIEVEKYRADLIDSIRSHSVILITARPIKYQDVTLQNISSQTGWSPGEAFFNDNGYWPPAFKKSILDRFLLKRKLIMFGIESNPRTRSMYLNQGIKSCCYSDFIKEPKKWLSAL